jgi:hypothetical protein
MVVARLLEMFGFAMSRLFSLKLEREWEAGKSFCFPEGLDP